MYYYHDITIEQYNQLQTMLDQLIDIVGEDESHPLARAMSIIGDVIENTEFYDLPIDY